MGLVDYFIKIKTLDFHADGSHAPSAGDLCRPFVTVSSNRPGAAL
ncbi:hypothetical protein Pvag_2812 [Pantoea vagans C9-1]|nr:hypothetical protein Pvag_2812 [Pantoea vagans C9-1]